LRPYVAKSLWLRFDCHSTLLRALSMRKRRNGGLRAWALCALNFCGYSFFSEFAPIQSIGGGGESLGFRTSTFPVAFFEPLWPFLPALNPHSRVIRGQVFDQWLYARGFRPAGPKTPRRSLAPDRPAAHAADAARVAHDEGARWSVPGHSCRRQRGARAHKTGLASRPRCNWRPGQQEPRNAVRHAGKPGVTIEWRVGQKAQQSRSLGAREGGVVNPR